MIVFHKVKDLKNYLLSEKATGKQVGFVPTMGALHEGHLAIIRKSEEENDITIASIFVNPTQFNNQQDFDKYPITTAKDIGLLEQNDCDVLFIPSVKEIYPEGTIFNMNFEVGYLDSVMEGKHRPGHFKGVAQVVKRLLDIVEPHILYLGQKDFQQFKLIEKMIADLKIPVKLKMAKTMREADGLAMSSRNRRLTAEGRKNAADIFSILTNAASLLNSKSVQEIKSNALKSLSAIPNAEPEYFEIADANNLKLLSDIKESNSVVLCCAVWINDVRLIDNVVTELN